MRDYNLCYPAILTNTLVPQPGFLSILQNQLGVALDALTLWYDCLLSYGLKLFGLYRHWRGLGLHKVGYKGEDIHIRIA